MVFSTRPAQTQAGEVLGSQDARVAMARMESREHQASLAFLVMTLQSLSQAKLEVRLLLTNLALRVGLEETVVREGMEGRVSKAAEGSQISFWVSLLELKLVLQRAGKAETAGEVAMAETAGEVETLDGSSSLSVKLRPILH
jgi:hypothetical protein